MKFVKIWINFPARGVTDAEIVHQNLLNIKQPSQLYHVGHASNMLFMRLRGDTTDNACIESKLEREIQWRLKSSTTVSSYNCVAHDKTGHKHLRKKGGEICPGEFERKMEGLIRTLDSAR